MLLSELLKHIESETGAFLNILALHPAFYEEGPLKLLAEQHLHYSPFCSFAKRFGKSDIPCWKNKEKSKKLAAKGRSFSGCCPYGLWELAQPVQCRAELPAVIYLGGFNAGELRTVLEGTTYQGPEPPLISEQLKSKLRSHSLFIRDFILIELEMWRKKGGASGKQKSADFYRNFCLQYIDRNYQDNIQLADLADALGVTPAFLSFRIRKSCGKTFSELLKEKRLSVAAWQLEFAPDLNITAIAFRCGFRDSNYFSTAFRAKYGMSPRAWRKQLGQ